MYLHAIGIMLVCCVFIATVDAGIGLWRKAIKEDLYEHLYHIEEARGHTVKICIENLLKFLKVVCLQMDIYSLDQ